MTFDPKKHAEPLAREIAEAIWLSETADASRASLNDLSLFSNGVQKWIYRSPEEFSDYVYGALEDLILERMGRLGP